MKWRPVSLFVAVLLLFGGTLEAQESSRQVPSPTIVIVHGAWGGGWAFREVDNPQWSKPAELAALLATIR